MKEYNAEKEFEIINEVTARKPYSFINRRFVEKLTFKTKARDDEEKVKLIRAKLRKISTSVLPLKFYQKFGKISFDDILKILRMHKSSNERLEIYPWLNGEIKKRGKSIVDLGCGFNLLALYHNDFVPLHYIGYDVDCAVVKFVSRFAQEKKINAQVFCSDVSDIELPDGDIYLCLKVFDALEDFEIGSTRKLLEKMKEKTGHIIVSFALKSLGGRGKLKERKWFEDILNELGMKFIKEEKGNEVFYFIEL